MAATRQSPPGALYPVNRASAARNWSRYVGCDASAAMEAPATTMLIAGAIMPMRNEQRCKDTLQITQKERKYSIVQDNATWSKIISSSQSRACCKLPREVEPRSELRPAQIMNTKGKFFASTSAIGNLYLDPGNIDSKTRRLIICFNVVGEHAQQSHRSVTVTITTCL
jgi:hypothetical protein